MSVQINMKMPKCCESCPCKTTDAFGGLGCQATGYIPLRKANQDRPDNCPLVPVPPHGDLIDRDALKAAICSRLCIKSEEYLSPAEATIVNEIFAAPTIIPADKEGKG